MRKITLNLYRHIKSAVMPRPVDVGTRITKVIELYAVSRSVIEALDTQRRTTVPSLSLPPPLPMTARRHRRC